MNLQFRELTTWLTPRINLDNTVLSVRAVPVVDTLLSLQFLSWSGLWSQPNTLPDHGEAAQSAAWTKLPYLGLHSVRSKRTSVLVFA